MKTLTRYIQEKLIIKKSKRIEYKYFPKTKKELRNIIEQRIEQEGNKVDLNDIDVSKITDMSFIFSELLDFNGNVSNWDVSNVVDMRYMFYECQKFNQDISEWDISNVKNMTNMFRGCHIEEKYKPKFI